MGTRRSWMTVFALLAAALIGSESRAEVAVETDAYGNYVKTTVLAQSSVRQLRVWRVMRRHLWGVSALNPEGDRAGDLAPFIAENPVNHNYPWAVWSHFNGHDYDLVWSRWERRQGWSPIESLTDGVQPGDDLAPQMVFDGTGRPYLVWWRDEEGIGAVYASFFLDSRWMTPLRVSDLAVDSRNPRLGIQSDGSVRVDYETGEGIETRVVSFPKPTTITDDLIPLNAVGFKGGLPPLDGHP